MSAKKNSARKQGKVVRLQVPHRRRMLSDSTFLKHFLSLTLPLLCCQIVEPNYHTHTHTALFTSFVPPWCYSSFWCFTTLSSDTFCLSHTSLGPDRKLCDLLLSLFFFLVHQTNSQWSKWATYVCWPPRGWRLIAQETQVLSVCPRSRRGFICFLFL